MCFLAVLLSVFLLSALLPHTPPYSTHCPQAAVVTEGVFTLPPTKAFDVQTPEIMGLSAAGKGG